MKYLAHISEDGLREQTVEEHCENVAELAAQFAELFHAESWGYCAVGNYAMFAYTTALNYLLSNKDYPCLRIRESITR